uniref:Ras protein specific guanine nucleotide releasing factor 1 n=1 Tax=Callorhinchus milii TaxID=7868 RepID=A0A4W3JPQ0_CALMI
VSHTSWFATDVSLFNTALSVTKNLPPLLLFQYYFTINFGHDGQKVLELRTEDVKDCEEWMTAITHASYRNLATEHESLMQKYLHLLQIVETEKTVAKRLRLQIEDQEIEVERLKAEITSLLKSNERNQCSEPAAQNDEDFDITKIKKVQSFLRGWLCRRKWKTIIQDYIRSPHAESMRKRNQVVFSMLEAEAEYVQQLHILVNCFLRPLRMAASSKKPPINHDDVSSIFLNSETIMFLHQIFYQGLKARVASWPTLVLGKPLCDRLLHFAHQTPGQIHFTLLLLRAACLDCVSLAQIPRYILTLHELLAHTPHEHVERKSLEYAKSKLEELSRIMHDEVSETENIRKNLAIERMIVEGCEILLDTSQTFVRQGTGKLRTPQGRRERETSAAFKRSLPDLTRPEGTDVNCCCCCCGGGFRFTDPARSQDMEHLDFKMVVEPKDSPSFTIILVASSRQEKAAWTSDISQCIDNIRCNGLMMNAFEENSKVTVPQMIKSDTSLYCDDVDIRFSKTLNSCKVLQIRYASVERLLERLTDLRFLSIDFLNTFLHSYRVFTTAEVVLDKLITIYKKPISAIPARSLELFLASSQNNKLLYGEPPKSPRASRKFSSPPPLSISKSSSPIRRRKLSLNIPIITGGKALDLAAMACSSNGYASMYSSMSPFSKTTLDINKLYVSMVVTTCREMDGNRSSLSAASAFAIATAGANEGTPTKEKLRRMICDKEFVIRRAATNRVLNVLRHWVSKHSQDFNVNSELKSKVIGFLEEVIHDPELLTQERKAAANIIRLVVFTVTDFLLKTVAIFFFFPFVKAEEETFENLSALEIAEELTLLDHIVFRCIPYGEFFGQGWMKPEKNERAPYIMKTTKHFNDMSNLIASEILKSEDVNVRTGAIEKWVAVADICKCLHNYNAVLEISSALNRSAIFRLKKTWLKVSKQTKALIDKLQKLVSSEGRFKNLREALRNCDPPCVPYLGMYLTDLAFIEEGTPNYTEDGLVNFSKMRMISHIIREIRQFQQNSYKIEQQPKVCISFLLPKYVLDEESLYEASLRMEPKLPT